MWHLLGGNLGYLLYYDSLGELPSSGCILRGALILGEILWRALIDSMESSHPRIDSPWELTSSGILSRRIGPGGGNFILECSLRVFFFVLGHILPRRNYPGRPVTPVYSISRNAATRNWK